MALWGVIDQKLKDIEEANPDARITAVETTAPDAPELWFTDVQGAPVTVTQGPDRARWSTGDWFDL